MRVVRGARLAFQAGIEEFEPPSPLQKFNGGSRGRRRCFASIVTTRVRYPGPPPSYAVVALWEGNSLSARLRWVRFPSAAPKLLTGSTVGRCAWLLTRMSRVRGLPGQPIKMGDLQKLQTPCSVLNNNDCVP